MQAKALRSAVDSGFEVRPYVIERAIRDVREHYQPEGCPRERRKKSSRSTRADSPIAKVAARRRWRWRQPVWFACKSLPSTTTGGFRRILRSLNRR